MKLNIEIIQYLKKTNLDQDTTKKKKITDQYH